MVSYLAKVVMLGAGGVGKTSLIRRYVQFTFSHDYLATIGSNFLIKRIILNEEKKMSMQLWDLAGQESFRSIRSKYYLGASGGILVFDLTRQITFQDLEDWYTDFTQKVGKVPLLLLGNKCDLNDQIEVHQEDAETMAQKFGASYTKTSALDGTGVESAFLELAWKIAHFKDRKV